MKIYCSRYEGNLLKHIMGKDLWVQYNGYINSRGTATFVIKILHDVKEASTGNTFYSILCLPILCFDEDSRDAFSTERWYRVYKRIFNQNIVTKLDENNILKPLDILNTEEVIGLICDANPSLDPDILQSVIEEGNAE